MDLLVFRSMWGIERPWADVLPDLTALGYDGIEAPLPDLTRHAGLLRAYPSLRCLPMIFTEGDSVEAHVRAFRAQLEACRPFDPLRVTCHDGRDAWSDDEADAYYAAVLAVEADLGIPVGHETHRGRILYNPWTTRRLLDRFERLSLCCDFSHWVCVCERLLEDLHPILLACAERALHIHARVGYEEGPQVPDPRAPEYEPHLLAHEQWWTLIWEDQRRRGLDLSSLTPEFGPPLYLHTLPYTRTPVANLSEVCNWVARRQRERFEAP